MNQSAFAAAGLYAVLCSGILFWLTIATGLLRRKHRVSIGDGGVPHLVRIMRGHANAIEAIPIFLLLLVIAAALDVSSTLIHVVGLLFTAGRAIHAWHFIREDAAGWQRSAGFGASLVGITAAVVIVLFRALPEL